MQSLLTRTLAIIGLHSAAEATGGNARSKAPKARKIRFESLERRLVCDDGADVFENVGIVGELIFTDVEDAPTLTNALEDIVFTG